MSLVFHEYDSIDAPYVKKNFEYIRDHGHLESNINWVATEKVHGANFSFIVDRDNNLEIAKRSGLVGITEIFFDASHVKKLYAQDSILVMNKIAKDYPALTSINIFGEIYGGAYPNLPPDPTKRKVKAVQRGVYYCDQQDFLVFDIRINQKEAQNYYLAFSKVLEYISGTIFKSVPVLGSGTYQELIKLPVVFLTRVPAMHNLPEIPNNFAEGYVLKTNQDHMTHVTRPMFKCKNPQFAEIDETKTKARTKTPKEITEELPKSDQTKIQEFVQEAEAYCTPQRFDNLISKLGNSISYSKLCSCYVEDVCRDFRKNLDEELFDIFDAHIIQVKNLLFKYLGQSKLIRTWINEREIKISN